MFFDVPSRRAVLSSAAFAIGLILAAGAGRGR